MESLELKPMTLNLDLIANLTSFNLLQEHTFNHLIWNFPGNTREVICHMGYLSPLSLKEDNLAWKQDFQKQDGNKIPFLFFC